MKSCKRLFNYLIKTFNKIDDFLFRNNKIYYFDTKNRIYREIEEKDERMFSYYKTINKIDEYEFLISLDINFNVVLGREITQIRLVLFNIEREEMILFFDNKKNIIKKEEGIYNMLLDMLLKNKDFCNKLQELNEKIKEIKKRLRYLKQMFMKEFKKQELIKKI